MLKNATEIRKHLSFSPSLECAEHAFATWIATPDSKGGAGSALGARNKSQNKIKFMHFLLIFVWKGQLKIGNTKRCYHQGENWSTPLVEKFIAKYHNARDGQLVLNLENKEEKRDREKGYVLKLALFLVVPAWHNDINDQSWSRPKCWNWRHCLFVKVLISCKTFTIPYLHWQLYVTLVVTLGTCHDSYVFCNTNPGLTLHSSQHRCSRRSLYVT